MKRVLLAGMLLSAMCLTFCRSEVTQEEVTNKSIDFFNLSIDMPANWKIEKLLSSETAEIGFTKKGGSESLMLIEEIKSDSCITDPAIIAKQLAGKDGYKLLQEVNLKNGAGITYQFNKSKGNDKISKAYWFVVQAKGECYSIKNKIYNNGLEFFAMEKSAMESIK